MAANARCPASHDYGPRKYDYRRVVFSGWFDVKSLLVGLVGEEKES